MTATNPSDFIAGFERGVHYLHVVSQWQYGDASAYAKVDVA